MRVFSKMESRKKDSLGTICFVVFFADHNVSDKISVFSITRVFVSSAPALLFFSKSESGENNHDTSLMHVICFLVRVCFCLQYTEYRVENFNPHEQLLGMIHNPIKTLWIFIFSIHTQFAGFINATYYISCEGAIVPGIMSILFFCFVLYSLCATKKEMEFTLIEKMWIFTIVIAVWMLMDLALYLSFSPVGALAPIGVQGRYLTPTILILIYVMSGRVVVTKGSSNNTLAWGIVYSVVLTMSMSYYFY